MKLLNNILYIEYNEMVGAGFSENTIRKAKNCCSKGWSFIDDPEDRRRNLIEYEVLKDLYKEKIKHHFCDGKCNKDHAKTCTFNIYKHVWVEVIYKALFSDIQILSKGESFRQQLAEHRLDDGTGLPDSLFQAGKTPGAYLHACMLLHWMNSLTTTKVKKLGFPNTQNLYEAAAEYIKRYELKLPKSYRKLRQSVTNFKAEGYTTVISKHFGNERTRKIKGEIADWLVAQYAQPIKTKVPSLIVKYNKQDNGWPSITQSALQKYLMGPSVEPLWYMGRHGVKEWKKKFEHRNKLFLPTHRNAMWCSDGSKLDLYYQIDGKRYSKLQIYIVVDVASEMIIGYHISESEDFVAQYNAYRKALEFTGEKPYQILYDNQGGHKRPEAKELYNKLSAACHFPARPYNSESKPVELVLGRFQQEVLREHWFATGQGIKSRELDSHGNIDHIIENTHKLPNREQVIGMVPAMVNTWNLAKHPKADFSRSEWYDRYENPMPSPVSQLDFIDMFWVTRDRAATYRRDGIRVQFSASMTNVYEVYDQRADIDDPFPAIDAEFRRNYIGAKFVVKYDPSDLSHVRLYLQVGEDIRFVAIALKAREHARAIQDQQPGDRARLDKDIAFRDQERKSMQQELEEVRDRSGVSPDDLYADYDQVIREGAAYHSKEKLHEAEFSDQWLDSFYTENIKGGKSSN